MAWPYSQPINWGQGQEVATFDDQPVDADTLILAGMPLTLNPGSAPVNCVRPAVVADAKFAGFAEASANNLLANFAAPNILLFQNYGDGTTGVGGAKCRIRSQGLIRFDARVPDGTGVAGGITGLVGTQADVDVPIYYNGTGFTTTSAGGLLVGEIAAVGKTSFSVTYWDLRFRSHANRNS